MRQERQDLIRSLFDEYIEMYAARDDRLTARFSENFSGYTGGGDFLVKDRAEWAKITRQDFSQVTSRIRIEMLDLAMQDLSADVVVATAFFHIHLPIPDSILSRETARLVLIFRLEGADWKIVHSGISIPYGLVRDGEVYPIKGLRARNLELESLVVERTLALEEANMKLQALSNTDGLTGIANRRKFDNLFAQEWNRAQRTGTPLALVMLDVDLFKHYNDHYGHVAGDSCLQALAGALVKAGRRAGELVARYGGEEFVVLLPDTNGHDALEAARNMQHEVWSLALPHTETVPGIVTFSLGVASLVPSSQHSPEYLIQQADLALYRAKEAGRNCVQLATDAPD
ncbi:MAG: diguanylate cyclase [Rhodoferax sp.]|uniref:diguanylate cyclase n=1 Tax=Rhodoferax sp. TaxID=50421 RepID=UPI00180E1CDB|nr:diguanylate cyclase [Rhodoferax sp.]NMM12751.1 diguanylate cyclase [Rhodoferax sp.]NMM19904.1 diguanylate cyclase [Rhodoferax sp.]